MITLTSRFDGFTLSAFHAPAQGTRRGGLVLAQEIFGVTPPIRAISERFAARVPVHLYDAGHGFCRMGHPAHDAAACDLAVERTVAHFLAHA